MPNKFFEFIQAGLPILSNNLIEVDKVIKMKYDVPNDHLEMLDDYITQINDALGRFLNTDYRKEG